MRLLGATNIVKFAVITTAKIDIKSLQFHELEDKVREFGQPLYRARQIADWLYQKRVQSFDEMTDLPLEVRTRLAERFAFDKIDVVRTGQVRRAKLYYLRALKGKAARLKERE